MHNVICMIINKTPKQNIKNNSKCLDLPFTYIVQAKRVMGEYVCLTDLYTRLILNKWNPNRAN